MLSKRSGFDAVLSTPVIARLRRNHGLEHATLHILAQHNPKRRLAGHSDAAGFWILGELTTQELQSAVQEALRRMQAGEKSLAVHPNCGTNFVTSGVLTSLAAFIALFGAGRRTRDWLERLPLAATLATLALIISQPLGLLLQERVTTSGQPGALEVVKITPSRRGRMQAHRIQTRS